MPKNRYQRSIKKITVFLSGSKITFELDKQEHLIKSKKEIKKLIHEMKTSLAETNQKSSFNNENIELIDSSNINEKTIDETGQQNEINLFHFSDEESDNYSLFFQDDDYYGLFFDS